MSTADQIAAALQHITAHGGDLPLETDLALKALAADYERVKADRDELKIAQQGDVKQGFIYFDKCAKLEEEIERLKGRLLEAETGRDLNGEQLEELWRNVLAVTREAKLDRDPDSIADGLQLLRRRIADDTEWIKELVADNKRFGKYLFERDG